MKNIFNIKTLAAAVLIAGMGTSCIEDDQNNNFADKPEMTVAGLTNLSIAEGETTTVTLNLEYPYKETVDFKLELTSGGSNDDYFVSDVDGNDVGATTAEDGYGAKGYKITFPVNSTTVSFDITATKDMLAEDTETLGFTLRSTGSGLGSGVRNFNLDVTNYATDNFGMILDWSGAVSYKVLDSNVAGTDADDEEIVEDHDGCDMADFDAYLTSFDAYAFTGNCPEFLIETVDPNTLATSALADGTYTIEIDYWDWSPLGFEEADEELISDFSFPMELTISKVGKFNATLDLSSLYFFTDDKSNISGSGVKVAATIDVVGGKYTVYDANGDLVAAE